MTHDIVEQWQAIGDELGPAKAVLVADAGAGLRGVVVIDSVATGPAIGGVRMACDVTFDEVRRLARAMTLKNAAAGLAHGGGKAGIVADPGMDPARKHSLMRAFAVKIRELEAYIPGPDMGTDETCMAVVHDEIGRCVGLPRVLGGIPLDEIGATGFGVAVAAEAVAATTGLKLSGARVVIQGFGAVGQHAARFLSDRGAIIVGVSDSAGACVCRDGIDIADLVRHKGSGASVATYSRGTAVVSEALVGLETDLWIPAARPDVFTEANAGAVRAKVILQGANIPATPAAEAIFHERGILSIPDFIANAGGVICAAAEYHGGTQGQAFAAIEEKIRANTIEVIERAHRNATTTRTAAVDMAKARVQAAMAFTRQF